MKPHEEEWAVYQSGKANHGVRRKGGGKGSVVATRIETYDEAMLLSAAPDMARALLVSGCVRVGGTPVEKWHTDHCWDKQDCGRYECLPDCVAARAALTRAGVLS